MKTPSLSAYFCSRDELLDKIDAIDPVRYQQSRNYLDGAVTWLSPFITHGITNTKEVAGRVLLRHSPKQCEQFLFELGWREFFHRTWQVHGDAIFDDMRAAVSPHDLQASMPSAILRANTGIRVVDDALVCLSETGLMHNHARMWVAGITCNVGRTHWRQPAEWLHYHLLDGDLASNTLSWQWVAGTFSNKCYLANQGNINRFSRSEQSGTFLDISYEQLASLAVPEVLTDREALALEDHCPLDTSSTLDSIEPVEPVALRSIWNLKADWQGDKQDQLVFVDVEQQARWPMSPTRWQFIQHWVNEIDNAKLIRGTGAELQEWCAGRQVVCQEYTACRDWLEPTHDRDWLYPMPAKSFNSFFAFWKQVKHSVGL